MITVRLHDLLSKKSIEVALSHIPQQGDTLQVNGLFLLVQGITAIVDENKNEIYYDAYVQKINKQHWINTLLDLKF